MDASRYEIVDTIATGDFATVYRARDRDLGREVAVKQIHQQFLANEQQLARYWQEAQLLAQLQHPNVLTIYDIVRPRGWLILELMQGNLAPGPGGEPMDLDYLRVVLAGCLNALQFLHGNGVIHGDIKPSNMLFDKQKRVKLGDFGLARRANSEEGSLLKGTTKYMAPELVSNAFGAVGPASDLYSLGFSAYELMCGGQFGALFPGLDSFGRDKQIAWMMWHAAPDRRLPPIARVLEGVPEDLARVIQGLTAKDQARRYQSAEQVLRDLQFDPLRATIPAQAADPAAEAAAAAEAKKKKRMRIMAIVAMCFSVMLCIAMLLPKPEEKKPVAVKNEPTKGTVRNVYPEENRFVLELEDGQPQPIRITPRDRIVINDKKSLLGDLRSGDRAVVEYVRDDDGQRIAEVTASRPDVHSGRIAAVKADEGKFTLAYQVEGKPGESQLDIKVPADLPITFNEKDNLNGRKLALPDLLPEDRVVVHHMGEETGRVATQLSVTRTLRAEGVLRDVGAAKGQMTVAVGEGGATMLTLPVLPDCEVTLNDRRALNEQLLKPGDLQAGDKVTIAYDTRILRINAYRILGDHGVIQTVSHASGTMNVLRDGQTAPTTYVVRPPCEVTLGGEPAQIADLRDGDEVDIRHDTPGAQTPVAMAVAARRTADLSRWAILIANQNFEDKTVTPLATPLADAGLLRSALIKRYQVLPAQIQLLTDESLVRLEQGIPNYLKAIKPTDDLIVYVTGHAYKDDSGNVYLAPKNFDRRRMESTGLPLQWLVDQLEGCPSQKKLLLLDCCHGGDGADVLAEPSTTEMIQSLKAPPNRAPLRTLTAIASCVAGQRGLVLSDNKSSLFPWLLAYAYSGLADKNRDNRLEPTELFSYLTAAMPQSAQKLGGVQTPRLFLPDARPPRLSDDAKKAIRRLASYLRQDTVNIEAIQPEYAAATQLAGKELEPRLLFGLLLMKGKDRDAALKHLEELKIEHPKLLLPMEGMAWLRFEKRSFQAGTDELIELVSAIPLPAKQGEEYSEDIRRVVYWAGQLREYAAIGPEENWRPSPQSLDRLDQAVKAHGPDAERYYEMGRAKTRSIASDFDKRSAGSENVAEVAKIKVERRRLVHYVAFPFDRKGQEALSKLDE